MYCKTEYKTSAFSTPFKYASHGYENIKNMLN